MCDKPNAYEQYINSDITTTK
uniref:Uncharacterized protein n=1 Tax=Arundo donax TaxID=35708 RepID=A0A0A8YD62_ARUDO